MLNGLERRVSRRQPPRLPARRWIESRQCDKTDASGPYADGALERIDRYRRISAAIGAAQCERPCVRMNASVRIDDGPLVRVIRGARADQRMHERRLA